ncbi:MAG: hypothetical protein ACPLRZ_11485 [Thermovenabulum sp.]|uniref:hypothetical protein n=1 Tax=Thermovenabulum sp. TaxID=3100335 RepID=UPI003C7DD84D
MAISKIAQIMLIVACYHAVLIVGAITLCCIFPKKADVIFTSVLVSNTIFLFLTYGVLTPSIFLGIFFVSMLFMIAECNLITIVENRYIERNAIIERLMNIKRLSH